MNLASDPTIQRKFTRMAERVRWKQPSLSSRGIDQTRLVLDPDGDQTGEDDAFHFLVLGDSGTGRHRFHSPPRRIAERLLPHSRMRPFCFTQVMWSIWWEQRISTATIFCAPIGNGSKTESNGPA